MNIFGRDIKRDEITKKIGDISQFGGIKSYEFSDGKAKGIRAVDIKTPCGIDMTVLLDRAMDISSFTYKNIPIAWRSSNKETSPVYYESKGFEFQRTFFGGLLTTCGLTYIGAPSTDNGEDLGLHGRISNLPAENVYADGKWDGNSYVMWVQGKIREAGIFQDKLELTRKITIWMDKPGILIQDSVENIGSETSPIMILYHINIGFPLLDTQSELIIPKAKTIPRDSEAEKGINSFTRFTEPIRSFSEQVYFHDIEPDSEGNCSAALVNRAFNNNQGLGISLKFNKKNLPYLIQWKQMGFGEYVCGIEPANSFVRGRAIERQEKTLRFIEPGEKIDYRLELDVLESNKEIDAKTFRKLS